MSTIANWNLRRLAIALTTTALVGLGVLGATRMLVQHAKSTETVHPTKADLPRYVPTAAEWASLTVEPVSERAFRAEHVTEGKIAVNEESSTPIFSPYAGRMTKLLVKPSDMVERGQPLFIIEATDTVQGLNDFVAALGALNTARSKLNLAQIVEKRANDLYAGKAVPLKDWQQSQADLTTAQNDLRSAETALEAAHNRLRILGRLRLLWEFTQRGGHLLFLAVAVNVQFHDRAGRRLRNAQTEVKRVRNLLTVQGGDHVAFLESRLGTRAIGRDVADERTLGRR